MLKPKKKISKREMKEDTLITYYARATTFYETYTKQIQMGFTALVVIVIASVVIMKNRAGDNQQAMTQLGAIFSYYDNNQYQLAIDGIPERNLPGLKSIVDHYGSTSSGDLARFYLANAHYHLGKYDEALTEFKDSDPSGSLLASSRLSGIAACYEAKGQHAEAAEYFEKAAAKDAKDVTAAENLNNAARNYGQAGEKDRAIELYKKLKKNYPTTTFARDADRFIAQFSA